MAEGRTLWVWSTLPKQPLLGEDQTWRKEGDAVENVHRIHLSGHSPASFDRICSGVRPPYSVQHDIDLLAHLAKLGKPGATVEVCEVVKKNVDSDSKLKTVNQLTGLLKMSGFVSVENHEVVNIEEDLLSEIRDNLALHTQGEFIVVRIRCKLPYFAVGSSCRLSFASKIKPAEEETKEKAWTIDLNDDEVDFIDEETLLDEDDLKKPDPASLRVCGTTGQRKACKDCSCGLKEELEGENKVTAKSATSSCGSCYLGDAFRCASCPYLGMPAFKPGEKIQLSDRQLNPDK